MTMRYNSNDTIRRSLNWRESFLWAYSVLARISIEVDAEEYLQA